MKCPRCGAEIGMGLLVCPECHSMLIGLPDEPAPVHTEVISEPPSAGGICPREWCGQEYPVGATVCPRCFQPVSTQARISAVQLVLPGGMTVRATPSLVVVIGRESPDTRIADSLEPYDGVSRRHAELAVDDAGVTVTDLRSTNGTFVNGRPCTTERLEPGQHQLRLGRAAVVTVDVIAGGVG